MDASDLIHHRLQAFAEAVKAKTAVLVLGQPEEQLRAPFESFVVGAATDWNWEVVCVGEASLPDRLGRPDYAVERNKLLAGYVELKAPGAGANANRFRGRNRDQFKRFSGIPNLLYTDGNEWALYRSGERVGTIVRFSGDITVDGRDAVSPENARSVERLLHNFLNWEPFLPLDRRGKIDLKGFAMLLAPQCRMLRDDVTEALSNAHSSLTRLATDWRELLFPAATDAQFADAYAQTVAFALLLGRSIGADPLTLQNAQDALSARHNLLSRALQVLTDPQARTELSTSLDLLLRVVGIVPPATLASPENPWLYFYEDFLAAYDPKLRKDAGAYYTPVEVVRTQVRLIDELLVERFGRQRGFAASDVVTLDPATGTGTYLLAVIEHALTRVEAKQGAGAVPGQASALAGNLYGFELMVGSYAVAELRVTRALQDYGAELPVQGTHIYLSDTLESPHAEPAQLPLFLQPIADQHARALEVKRGVPVLVCLGNPPYDRHEAATGTNSARTGSWVRWGDDGDSGTGCNPERFHRASNRCRSQPPAQEPLQPLRIFLALGAVEGLRAEYRGRSRHRQFHHGVELPGRQRLCRDARAHAPGLRRNLDSRSRRRGARDAPERERFRHSDAGRRRRGDARAGDESRRASQSPLRPHRRLARREARDAQHHRRLCEGGVAGLPGRLACAIPSSGRGRILHLASADRSDAVAAFRCSVQTDLAYRSRCGDAGTSLAGLACISRRGFIEKIQGNA